MSSKFKFRLALVASAAVIAACGGGDNEAPVAVVVPEEIRDHDSRKDFAMSPADAAATTFAAMTKQATDAVDVTTTSRWVCRRRISASTRSSRPKK